MQFYFRRSETALARQDILDNDGEFSDQSEEKLLVNLLCPRHFQWGSVGGGAYSITAVRPYVRPVRPVRPVRNTFGFRAISFERICVLDWNFLHRYIIIKYKSSSI